MKGNFFSTLARMHRVIKENGQISKPKLVLQMRIAPSTFYNYLPYLLEHYPDISYDGKLLTFLGNNNNNNRKNAIEEETWKVESRKLEDVADPNTTISRKYLTQEGAKEE